MSYHSIESMLYDALANKPLKDYSKLKKKMKDKPEIYFSELNFNPKRLKKLMKYGSGLSGGGIFDKIKDFIAGKTKVKPSTILKWAAKIARGIEQVVPKQHKSTVRAIGVAASTGAHLLEKTGRGKIKIKLPALKKLLDEIKKVPGNVKRDVIKLGKEIGHTHDQMKQYGKKIVRYGKKGKGQMGAGILDDVKRFFAGKTKVKPSTVTGWISTALAIAAAIPNPYSGPLAAAAATAKAGTVALKKSGRGVHLAGAGNDSSYKWHGKGKHGKGKKCPQDGKGLFGAMAKATNFLGSKAIAAEKAYIKKLKGKKQKGKGIKEWIKNNPKTVKVIKGLIATGLSIASIIAAIAGMKGASDKKKAKGAIKYLKKKNGKKNKKKISKKHTGTTEAKRVRFKSVDPPEKEKEMKMVDRRRVPEEKELDLGLGHMQLTGGRGKRKKRKRKKYKTESIIIPEYQMMDVIVPQGSGINLAGQNERNYSIRRQKNYPYTISYGKGRRRHRSGTFRVMPGIYRGSGLQLAGNSTY